jgi:hypothetical protein
MPSSVIRDHRYEPADRRLDILFVSGRLYSYHDVPPEVGLGMARAFAKGEYFNRHIRDRYRFTRSSGTALAGGGDAGQGAGQSG